MRGCGHHFMGRHHGGRGFGRFGRRFTDGDNGPGDRGLGMGRKLAAVDLKLLILRLLEDKPRHGYEIIKELDERSRGFYVPSPGMIYPALTYLEEVGLATIEADGNRKRYHITDLGIGYLTERRAAAEALLAQFEQVALRMERVRRAMRAADAGEEFRGDAAASAPADELAQARCDLRRALDAVPHRSQEDQRRIAGILRRAAADIRSEHAPG